MPACSATAALRRGTLDALIFKVLEPEPMHGLGISRRIAQVTRGTFQLNPLSLFPALHRMEEVRWLASWWGESENNQRAKFSRSPKVGRCQLRNETAHWRISPAMARP